MGQDDKGLKPSESFKELLTRVDCIRDNSSVCGEYTDEQAHELAGLCTQLVDTFNHVVISLENECDRLRDGPRSMVEGDYIYYRDSSVVPLTTTETRVCIQSLDGEGKLRFTELRGDTFRVEQRLLDDGGCYYSIELVQDAKTAVDPELLKGLP
jgi:hypothetical protein